jgi:hypothetical protein
MLLVMLAVGLGAPVSAQTPDDDGPGRGVARISLLNGDVSVRRGDSGDMIAAGVNAPLVVQDRVMTGSASRTELQFDWANFLRVAANAEVRLAELEHQRYIVQVARGTVTWRVLRDHDAYIEVSTPSVSVRPVRKGTYRVTVLEDGSSEITVRSGEAEVFTPRGSERIRSGRTMMARGSASDPEFRVGDDIPEDDWDRWNIARDRDLQRSRSYQYVSRDIYGAEDLDTHGRWVYVGNYGWVWSPRVAIGWAPYRHGRWAWIDWYGWSWVSYDPWGWAPYHYGRWFYNGPYGWCWWPGAIRARHYWSPGFVAFFGFGGGGAGFGWGRVGWVPLAPWESFTPWWGRRWYGGYRNPGYYNNRVTVVNNINIRNVYRNARVDHGVTVVDNDGFRRGRLGESVRLNTDEFRQVSVARGPLPVTPERQSLRFADREPSVRLAGAENRGADRFFSNRRPAEVERVPFDQQRRGVEQIARRAFDDEVRTAGSPANDGQAGRGSRRGVESAAAPETRSDEQRGWRRVGDTTRTGTADRAAPAAEARPAQRGSENEWRRFGSARVAEPSDSGRGERGARTSGEPAAARSVEAAPSQRGSDSEWRRFGSARVTESPESVRSERGGRSFGEPSAPRSDVAPRSSDTDRPSDSNWRRFGGSSVARPESAPSRGSDSERSDRSARPESPRMETQPRWSGRESFDNPRVERRGDVGGGGSIRISPPIVRERGGDFGGGARSSGGSFDGARSAPSGGMRGGGGGGSRGGDGGGMRSSGGGGTRGSDGGGRGGRGR